jgi:hypothetical protein
MIDQTAVIIIIIVISTLHDHLSLQSIYLPVERARNDFVAGFSYYWIIKY